MEMNAPPGRQGEMGLCCVEYECMMMMIGDDGCRRLCADGMGSGWITGGRREGGAGCLRAYIHTRMNWMGAGMGAPAGFAVVGVSLYR